MQGILQKVFADINARKLVACLTQRSTRSNQYISNTFKTEHLIASIVAFFSWVTFHVVSRLLPVRRKHLHILLHLFFIILSAMLTVLQLIHASIFSGSTCFSLEFSCHMTSYTSSPSVIHVALTTMNHLYSYTTSGRYYHTSFFPTPLYLKALKLFPTRYHL